MIILVCFLFNALIDAKVRITEVLPHSDIPRGYYDYVELYNDGDETVNIAGHYLSDSKKNKMRCLIKTGDKAILRPKEHRSFSFQQIRDPDCFTAKGNCDNPAVAGNSLCCNFIADCPFRLSKAKEHIYYGRILDNGTYEQLDDVETPFTINRAVHQYWKTSIKEEHLLAFPTEGFDERYPIVGPFVFTEIVWDPPQGEQQYVKITCIFGKDSLTGPRNFKSIYFTNDALPYDNYRYQLRFEEHKELYYDNNRDGYNFTAIFKDYDYSITPSAFDIPQQIVISPPDSIYIVSGDPKIFAQKNNLDPKYVLGPWRGKIQNATSKNVWVGLFVTDVGYLGMLNLFDGNLILLVGDLQKTVEFSDCQKLRFLKNQEIGWD